MLRSTIRVLLERGYPVAIRNFETGDGRSGQDLTYQDLYIRSRRDQPYAVNLFGFNPPTFMTLLGLEWLAVPFEKRMNVMLPAWELDVLPPLWAEVFDAMDVVLTSSEFVAETVRKALPDLPVFRVYTAVYLPETIAPDRARWGVTDDEVVFFSAFDVTSDMRRKNPWAAVRAFQAAFGAPDAAANDPHVRLLIKLSNARLDPAYDGLVDELEAIAAADPRITLISEQLTYTDALSLYASSDVFVSLHRAEGLGLVLQEAMSLGKPVIATAYSGSMDFTTPENAALVDFELVPVEGLHYEYQDERTGGNAKWAEPSEEHAAEWMVKLATDSALRERIGAQAAADMDARRAAHMAGAGFEELRRFAEAYDPRGPVHRAKAARIRHMRMTAAARIPGRAVRSAYRRVRRALTSRSM